MSNQHATSCSERKALNMVVLREVSRDSVRFRAGNNGHVAYSEPADLARGRQVPFH